MKHQPLGLTPRKKNLRLMSNEPNNFISPPRWAPQEISELRIGTRPHKNVAAPRDLWFGAIREFPRESVLKEIAQQDRKML